MSIINRIDGIFALNKNKTKSPISKAPNILLKIPRQSFSDDTLSSSGSFHQTLEDTKRSLKAREIPVLKQTIQSKVQEIEFKQIHDAKNNLNRNLQKNEITKKKEREPTQIQLKKVDKLIPSKLGYSDEELEMMSSERLINEGEWLKKDQNKRNMNEKKANGVGNLVKGVYQAQRKDDKKINHQADERKILKEEEVTGLKSIEFSDISEVQSLICNSDGTLPHTTKLQGLGLESALESLKKFPLDRLIRTKDNRFDMRHRTTQEYFDLCGKAGRDPFVYYKENYKQVIVNTNIESENKKVSQGKIPNKRALSLRSNNELRKLQIFPLEELRMTKKGFFDKRYKLTQNYLDLCEKADQDPFKYYNENLESKENNDIHQRKLLKSSSLEVLANVKEKPSEILALKKLEEFDLDELKITKKGFFDQRFKRTHAYLELCKEANKDPLLYYKQNIK